MALHYLIANQRYLYFLQMFFLLHKKGATGLADNSIILYTSQQTFPAIANQTSVQKTTKEFHVSIGIDDSAKAIRFLVLIYVTLKDCIFTAPDSESSVYFRYFSIAILEKKILRLFKKVPLIFFFSPRVKIIRPQNKMRST